MKFFFEQKFGKERMLLLQRARNQRQATGTRQYEAGHERTGQQLISYDHIHHAAHYCGIIKEAAKCSMHATASE